MLLGIARICDLPYIAITSLKSSLITCVYSAKNTYLAISYPYGFPAHILSHDASAMAARLLPVAQSTSMKPRRARFSTRPFFLTILAITVFAILSLLSRSVSDDAAFKPGAILGKRLLTSSSGPRLLVRRDEDVRAATIADSLHDTDLDRAQCRLVHSVQDKCAFVRANCPDEEAGLFSYLQLYYCRLPHVKPIAFIILVLWLGLLFSTIGIAASDFLCINLSTIASLLGMSESLTGVTFLAFGNGSPDVFSTFAAMSTNSGSLAVGELIGAAGFITAVVAGSMALVRPFKVARRSFVRDVGFFIIATSFSMVFLANGKLDLWECAIMVGFYLFYVVFVVSWHYYLGNRRQRKEREATARSHFHIPQNQELEVDQDLEDDEMPVSRNDSLAAQSDDIGILERGSTPAWKGEDDEDDEDDDARNRYLAELRGNMRVSRPTRGERRNTINPIRPSLVGALEFRSILSSLEKSRSTHSIPINLRRYSDDPTATLSQHEGGHSVASDPQGPSTSHRLSVGEVDYVSGSDINSRRGRAVSANAASGLKLDTSVFGKDAGPGADLLGNSPPNILPSPRFSLSPAASDLGRDASLDGSRSRSPDHLAPPGSYFHRPDYQPRRHSPLIKGTSPVDSPKTRQSLTVPEISFPQLRSGLSSPASPFPVYTDEPESVPSLSRPPSIHLPPPSVSPESLYTQQQFLDDEFDSASLKWWPHSILPSPQVLLSTAFPTVYAWRGKTLWDKLLGLVAVPSVFLLTITLPVVEPDQEENVPDPDPGLLSPEVSSHARSGSLAVLPPDSPALHGQDRNENVPAAKDVPPHPSKTSKSHVRHDSEAPPPARSGPKAESSSSPKEWNRWLVSVQLFTAPFFVVLIVWANTDEELEPRNLLWFSLCSLLFSLICLAILHYATSPNKVPRYRPLLCFLGFLVAIAWIATIANEVVGVLKAFGVILGISDAILGLTIFAVGNSLGDLVADITVARLGYPVMALSACFGGPMLNILLGIGVSGLYLTLTGATHRHKKHPDRPIKYKPYHIEVSTTLLISGVTLLVTLVGLLIVVPLNNWRMDRKIGWGLITLWTLSTIGNLVVEVMGYGGDLAMVT